ncbi:MAG TPA: T9SS type A sorting domain-containing protein [Chryseolinea sp.]|nr:T9SS type A sorting domain-containing protein [Chryseolinea sp.]
MRIIVLILLLSLLHGILPAQQTYFSNNYEVYSGSNYTGSAVQTADSGFIFLSSNFVPNYLGYTFTRTNKMGDTLFTKRYVYTDRSFSVSVFSHSLVLMQDGNYLACGSAVDTNNDNDGYIIKFDSNGDTLWTKRFGGAGDDFMNSLYEDSDGNFWVCGSTTSQGNGLSDFWLVKMDTDCVILWDSTYGTAQDEGAVCGEMTFDEGFILSGCSGNSPYVVKVDSVGFPQWQFVYATYSGYGYVSQMPDSGYIMGCGKILSATESQASLIKLNAAGIEIWVQYTGFVNYHDIITTKPIITDSTIVAAGDSRPNGGYYEGYLTKTDLNGYLIWQRRYVKNPNNPHYLYDLIPTYDHGYLMGGTCLMTTQDAWLLKVDSMGCEVVGCDAVGLIELRNENVISVYPNPASEIVTFQFSDAHESRSIIIYDQIGREVWREETNENLVSISVNEFSAGMYFYRVEETGTVRAMGKLIIE